MAAAGGVSAWIKNLEVLAGQYTIYAPDLPGFGESESFEDEFLVEEYVLFLEKFTSALGLEHFHLAGHSLGGGIALNYTLEHPDRVENLVLISSLFLGSEIALWARYLSTLKLFRFLGRAGLAVFSLISRLVGFISPSREISPPFSRVQMGIGRSTMNLKGQTNVLLDRLAELVVPTLLVWGARDGVVPVRQAYVAAGVIPDCSVHVFQDCGHHVHNRKRKEFTRLLMQFLGGITVQ
jgi:pimeloyl-ACP methyl ester carboxylesterase